MIIDQEWGLAGQREPAAGLASSSTSSPTWSRRPCSPSSTGSPSAAGCWAPWRPATSAAGSRTSRCSTSTASTTARCRSSASTPSSPPTRRRRRTARSSWPAATEAEKQSQLDRLADFHARHAERGPGGARPAAGRRRWRRQRLRRADGRRPRVLARPDHRGVLRGRRAVPAQRLTDFEAHAPADGAREPPPLPFDPIEEAAPAVAGARVGGRRARHGRRHVADARAADRAGAGRRRAAPLGLTLRPLRAAHAAGVHPARRSADGRKSAPGSRCTRRA